MLHTGQPVALGLGANGPDPRGAIEVALAALAQGGVAGVQRASLYLTRPVDCAAGTPDFLNTAATGWWRGSPLALLALCRRIEGAQGRPAYRVPGQARVVDLDVLLVGERQTDGAALSVPHPRLTCRRFVLEPLAEIAPSWRVPPTFAAVAWWRDRLRSGPEGAGWGKRLPE